jgi:hypothetical protein
MAYDLFISYSRRDNEQGRVSQLVERIKADFAAFAGRELVPFFDKRDILGMEDWRHKILRGLRESRLLLVCLSPAYLESQYCEWEFVEYLKYEISHLHGFNGVAPIYFVEVPAGTIRASSSSAPSGSPSCASATDHASSRPVSVPLLELNRSLGTPAR